jgi:hypothetical protein
MKATVAYSEGDFQRLSVEPEGNHETPQSGHLVARPTFEPGTFRMHYRHINLLFRTTVIVFSGPRLSAVVPLRSRCAQGFLLWRWLHPLPGARIPDHQRRGSQRRVFWRAHTRGEKDVYVWMRVCACVAALDSSVLQQMLEAKGQWERWVWRHLFHVFRFSLWLVWSCYWSEQCILCNAQFVLFKIIGLLKWDSSVPVLN